MNTKKNLYQYCLRLGDNSLILSHRLAEMSSNAPLLEEDIALSNIALDHLGQASELLQYAAKLEEKGKTEDDLAYKRTEREYFNFQLVEQPNVDFAYVMVRQFFIDTYNYVLYQQLSDSQDETLAAIAVKSLKEVKYHLRHSGQWLIRLGNGTELSNQKVQAAVNNLWMYTGELFEADQLDNELLEAGIAADLSKVKIEWKQLVDDLLKQSNIELPSSEYYVSGSRKGIHTEHLGHMISEMQYLQRSFPEANW